MGHGEMESAAHAHSNHPPRVSPGLCLPSHRFDLDTSQRFPLPFLPQAFWRPLSPLRRDIFHASCMVPFGPRHRLSQPRTPERHAKDTRHGQSRFKRGTTASSTRKATDSSIHDHGSPRLLCSLPPCHNCLMRSPIALQG